ncbi:hypothetical protein CRG98_039492 [Punica granatum]|uniref:Secreted protein n=1 Tax=Punica granatum TaxID=22663 RepID=A0A2I0I8X3_PUNGR|nr:hypothetical protein CRG98_039492 [Punica granatum]
MVRWSFNLSLIFSRVAPCFLRALAASTADLEVLSRKSVWIPVEASRVGCLVDGPVKLALIEGPHRPPGTPARSRPPDWGRRPPAGID